MDEDYLMGDDTIVGSTELNGDGQTIDPSVFMNSSTHDLPPRKEQLPILSYQEMTAVSSPPNFHANQAMAAGDDDLYDTNSTSPVNGATSDGSSPETTARIEPQVVVHVPPPPRSLALPRSTLRSGLVYSSQMRFHRDAQQHPEQPQRINVIWELLEKAGLIEDPLDEPNPDNSDRLFNLGFRPADPAEITLVHTLEHFEWVRGLRELTQDDYNQIGQEKDSIYVSEGTFHAACLAVGGAIEACRAVAMDDVKNAIAVIRPPGHHAEQHEASGFCIFNNVSIAAKVTQNSFSDRIRRILILDWDVHHGNGIQNAFYDNANVLYISIHVYKNGLFYPNGPGGDHLHCGVGKGEGKNVNIPWADNGMGDNDYLYAFDEVVIPIAFEFDPDLVIVAAGFDAAEGDELGGCHVSPAGYAHMTHKLMGLANGRLVVCLEGGYDLKAISKSALAVTKTLMGEPPDRIPGYSDNDPDAKASRLGVATVSMVKRHQAAYWHCMHPKKEDLPRLTAQSVQMHSLISDWRSMLFSKEYGLEPMVIDRNFLSRSFENNVLATTSFFDGDERPLLVIFHDPPGYDVIGDPSSIETKTELHNSWLTDGTKTYVEWTHKHGFAIVDVNVPKILMDWPEEGDTTERAGSFLREHKADYVPSATLDARMIATREVAKYLWENYIEIGAFTDVYLMGVGDAAPGLVEFIGTQESVNDNDSALRHVITFLGETALRSVRRATDDNIGMWYYKHSSVYVASTHAVCDYQRQNQRKLRKKYGKIKTSKHRTLGEMLEEFKPEITEMMMEDTEDWLIDQEEAKAAASNRMIEERDLRASSAPNSLRSPSNYPPIGMFTVSSPTPRSPANPPKRPQ